MQILGLHIEKEMMAVALVIKEHKKFVVKQIKKISLKESESLEGFFSPFKQMQQQPPLCVGSVLQTEEILLRTLEIPFKRKKALLQTLPFELEHMLPYPLDEGIIATILDKGHSRQAVATLFCTQKNAYQAHIAELQRHHIDPGWVGCVPQALYRFARHYTGEKEYIVLHMTEHATHMIVVVEDSLCHAFHINTGKQDFLLALIKDVGAHATPEELETLFYQLAHQENEFFHFTQKMKQFLQELDRIFYFLMHKQEEIRLDKVFFTQEEKFLKKFQEHMEQFLEHSIQIVDVKDASATGLKAYAIPIGTAIDVLSNDRKTLQFRTPQDTEKNLKKYFLNRFKKYAITLLSAAAMMILTAQIFLYSRKKQLFYAFKQIISHYAQEIGDISPKDPFLAALKKAEQKIQLVKKSYGYYIIPLQVSDVLKRVGDVIAQIDHETLELDHFHYELIEFPTLQEPLKSYKIKIHLAMRAEGAGTSEEFFGRFMEKFEGAIEDPQPVYSKEGNRYEVVFFLKNA